MDGILVRIIAGGNRQRRISPRSARRMRAGDLMTVPEVDRAEADPSEPTPDSRPREAPMFRRFLVLGFPCTWFLAAGGCQARRPRVAPSEPPAVPVSQPVRREVTDFVDFTGRTEAVHSVDIRPRVTGYLVEMPFQEGAEVKKGDLLFVVDPRPYKAQLDQAQGQVDLYKASLKLAKVTLA